MRTKQRMAFGLTLVLVFLSGQVASEHYHIRPDSITHCGAHSTGSCFSLAELALMNLQDQDNLTLSFLPGVHTLTERLKINSSSSVTLTGHSSDTVNIPLIRCQGTSGFELRDIRILDIVHLEFIGCGNVTEGGALYIKRASSVYISGCHFNNNYLIRRLQIRGGAIHMEDTEDIHIENSYFASNTVNSTSESFWEIGIGGGAISVYNGSMTITRSHCTNNIANYGGAIYIQAGSLTSIKTTYTDNTADVGGGAINGQESTVSIVNNVFTNNQAGTGGAVYTYIRLGGNITSINSVYANNNASYIGGAIILCGYRQVGIIAINDTYSNNIADSTGGALYAENGTIINSTFISNIVKPVAFGGNGGAIYILYGSLAIVNSNYRNNSANKGGAIHINGRLTVTNSLFENNTATEEGGAIWVGWQSSVITTDSTYANNIAKRGGAVYTKDVSNVTNIHANFTMNYALEQGGAVYLSSIGIVKSISSWYTMNTAGTHGGVFYTSGIIISNGSSYSSNSAGGNGGAIYNSVTKDTNTLCLRNCRNLIYGDVFIRNTASEGAAVFQNGFVLEILQTNINENSASNRGAVHINSAPLLLISGEFNFINNHGSLYLFDSKVEFKGEAVFSNNVGFSGGAISAVQSQVNFTTTSKITISNNTATYGGGISLIQSNLYKQCDQPIDLTQNTAIECGGGIYAYQSLIEFTSGQTQIDHNRASNGGAVCAIASNIQLFRVHVNFSLNVANLNGGAMYLAQNSKVYIKKQEFEYATLTLHVALEFTSNSAEKGGGIYIEDNTNVGVHCQGINSEIIEQTECFLQTLRTHDMCKYNKQNFINTKFTRNTASKSGSAIYGGLLDRCTINPSAELNCISDYETSRLNGFDYLKATVKIETALDYQNLDKTLTRPDVLIKAISRLNVAGMVSSDAVQVVFCENDILYPNYTHHSISLKKGDNFKVSVAAVDQIGNPRSATIVSLFSSVSQNSILREGQVEQMVDNKCTLLQYNAFSLDDTAELHIFAEGPCGDIGISRKNILLEFLPCTCSIGFQPSQSENECKCECDRKLRQNQIVNCSAETETILIETDVWVGLIDTANDTGIIIHKCSFDYCAPRPVNITLDRTNGTDKQCAFNRTGILCGTCQEDLSLVFGSSRCTECTHYYIFLLFPFTLAGIALVAFILLLNMTVSTGTIHGLIFYANILTANHTQFLPSTNFLTVFISWVNLDLGIETCFYDGMDSYGKFLFQLAFPIYVFILIGTVIVLCEVSKKFANFLGNRNPVSALCTLVLLSYSKLIRTIITALQFTHLDYPKGSSEIVWLYDANVSYFTVNHIPRFIAAFSIIILGTIYTALLLFGQWFTYCSNNKIMKWTKNTKYNAFIDAYHAPFTPRHRYWIGLLVLAQFIHNLVASLATESSSPLLSAGCITLGLILVKLLSSRIYKNKLQDSLETLFLINLLVLTFGTYHIRETNENQSALANTSMAISFILFLGILCYHLYSYIIKHTHAWTTVMKSIQTPNHAGKVRQVFHLEPVAKAEKPPAKVEEHDTNNQLREPALDILDPVYTEDYRETPPPPVVHNPPKITYTVIDAIPRQEYSVPC